MHKELGLIAKSLIAGLVITSTAQRLTRTTGEPTIAIAVGCAVEELL